MPVFADTFYYLALLNPADHMHARAVALTNQLTEPMVTTDWVLTELADGLSRPPARAVAVRFMDALRDDAAVTIVRCDAAMLDRGWELYRQRPDKGWSLTDCISFEVMRDQKLSQALTGDHHFEQAGFAALLRP
jgi:predicted nucleic acid-binding protein